MPHARDPSTGWRRAGAALARALAAARMRTRLTLSPQVLTARTLDNAKLFPLSRATSSDSKLSRRVDVITENSRVR